MNIDINFDDNQIRKQKLTMCAQWCTTVPHLQHLMHLCLHIFSANVSITVCIYKASLNARFHLHRTKHKNDCLSVIFLSPSLQTYQ